MSLVTTNKTNSSFPFVSFLPQEVINDGILSLLQFRDLRSLVLTSRATRNAVLYNPDLWHRINFSTLFPRPLDTDASTSHLFSHFLPASILSTIFSIYFDDSNITGQSIILVLNCCPRLRTLSAQYCELINMSNLAPSLDHLVTERSLLPPLSLDNLCLYRPSLPMLGPSLVRYIREPLEKLTSRAVTLDLFVCDRCKMLGASARPAPLCTSCSQPHQYCRHCIALQTCHICPQVVCYECAPSPTFSCLVCESDVLLCSACAHVDTCPSCRAWSCDRKRSINITDPSWNPRMRCKACDRQGCTACFNGVSCHCGNSWCEECVPTSSEWLCEFCGERYCDECFVPGAACSVCMLGHLCVTPRDKSEPIKRCKGCDFLWCGSCKERMWMLGCAGCPNMFCVSCANLLRWELCQDCLWMAKKREKRDRLAESGMFL